MCKPRNPLHCIIPPFMLENIAAHGSPLQQELAVASMRSGREFRTQRAIITRTAEPGVGPVREAVAAKRRLVYDAMHNPSLPGRLVRAEGDPPTGDAAVDEAYDGAGHTYDLFKDIYERNSIDDRGMPIESTVHYSVGYDNAFWNGQRMVYGDGDENLPVDQRLFNRFTISLDVIGHELAHGVSQFATGMIYENEPGALNESYSDVFGVLVRQRVLEQTASEADWLIGAELITSNVNGIAIRSMKEPGTAYNDPILGKDPQPGHMDDYVVTLEDAGGVHINSGIPNRAFYIMSVEMGGYAWEKAGLIWYVTLRDRLSSTPMFADAAQATYEVAAELFGKGSLEQKAVRRGWAEVGLEIDTGADEEEPLPPPVEDEEPVSNGCFATLLAGDFWRSIFGRK